MQRSIVIDSILCLYWVYRTIRTIACSSRKVLLLNYIWMDAGRVYRQCKKPSQMHSSDVSVQCLIEAGKGKIKFGFRISRATSGNKRAQHLLDQSWRVLNFSARKESFVFMIETRKYVKGSWACLGLHVFVYHPIPMKQNAASIVYVKPGKRLPLSVYVGSWSIQQGRQD